MAERKLKSDNIDSYAVLKLINEGAMGEVYLVEKEGIQYALKLLKTSDTDSIVRFRKESSAISRLKHPNLVRVDDVGEHDGAPYMVMEYIEGLPLDIAIQESRLSEERAVAIAIDVSSALYEIHRYGLVHRDLKPANIMIAEDGRVVLIDVGLIASISDLEEDFDAKRIVGTPLYSSPEQLRMLKRKSDHRSDLYSLGISLYEMLAGSPPFNSGDIGELMTLHMSARPASLLEVRDDISKSVHLIVEKLIAKDPDDRYDSSLALIEDLRRRHQIESDLLNGVPVELGILRKNRIDDAIPMVGRDDEIGLLDSLYKDRSQARVVIIEGDAGSGKSRLASEFLKDKRENTLVLKSKCDRIGTQLPLNVFRNSLDEIFQHQFLLEGEAREKYLDAIVAASQGCEKILKRLSVGFSKLLSDVQRDEVVSRDDSGEEENRDEETHQGLTAFFSRMAQGYSEIIFVVDDIQWIDESSARFIEREVDKLFKGLPIFLLSTSRNDEASVASLQALVEQWGVGPNYRLSLQPLTYPNCKELISHFIGGASLEEDVSKRLYSSSAGNPFVIGEYLRTLLDSGNLTWTKSGWVLNHSALDGLELSENVTRLITSRVNRLDPRVRSYLEVAAIVGNIFSGEMIAEALQRTPREVSEVLDLAVIGSLIERVDDVRYRFVHDRVKEAMLEQSVFKFRANSRLLAKQLEGRARFSPSEVSELARYYRLSFFFEDTARVFKANIAAARMTLDEYDNQAALEHSLTCQDCLELIEVESQELMLAIEVMCLSYIRVSKFTLGEQLLEKYWSALYPEFPVKMHFLMMTVKKSEGVYERAWIEFKRGLNKLGFRYPTTIFSKFLSINFLFFYFKLSLIGVSFRSVLNLVDVLLKRNLGEMHLFFKEGVQLGFWRGSPQDNFLISLYKVRYGYGPFEREGVEAMSTIALQVGALGLDGYSRYIQGKALLWSEKFSSPVLDVWTRLYVGMAKSFRGDNLIEAEQEFRTLLPESRKYLNTVDGQTNVMALAASYVFRGDYLNVLNLFAEQLRYLDESKQADQPVNARGVMYVALMGLGRYGEAAKVKVEWDRMLDRKRDNPFGVIFHPIYLLFSYFLEGESDADAELQIEFLRSLGISNYYTRFAEVAIAHIRLHQLERSQQETDFLRAERELRSSLRRIYLFCYGIEFTSHRTIILAGLHRIKGRIGKAVKALERLEVELVDKGLYLSEFLLYVEMARCHKKLSHFSKSDFYAHLALDLALEHRWGPQVKKVTEEFGIELSDKPSSSSAVSSSMGRSRGATSSKSTIHSTRSHLSLSSYGSSGTGHGSDLILMNRALDVLLKVGETSSLAMTEEEVCSRIIDEILKLFGAEKGYIFVKTTDENKKLRVLVARDIHGKDLTESSKYSATVVNEVFDKKEPLVVTGTDEGEALGSKSAVIHNLRSIIAIPLMLHDEIHGVMYLDSSMAKGLFEGTDIELLRAVGSHIIISMQRSKVATLQMAQVEMKKDLELSGAVQEMLLPEEAFVDRGPLAYSAFYRPAAQSGGDWWWQESVGESRLRLFVGDVTGHGAGAAMITAIVASCFRTYAKQSGQTIPELFQKVSDTLREVAKGKFLMTIMGVEVDWTSGDLNFWSAGAPPMYILRSDGELDVAQEKGTPMGSPTFSCGHGTVQLKPGDRVYITSDGMIEQEMTNGKMVGERRFLKLIKTYSDLELASLNDAIVREVDVLCSGQLQNDDYTLVTVELKSAEL